MIYRRNEKGRFEAVTDNGDIIAFEDASEMIAFAELRETLHRLVGRKQQQSAECRMQDAECRVRELPKRVAKIRIHKGEYVAEGTKLVKKEKTA